MAQVLELRKPGGAPATAPAPGDYVETPTAANIARSLTLLRVMEPGAATMIAGAPGVGKSRALAAYEAVAGQDCTMFTAAMGEGKPWNMGLALLRSLRGPHRDVPRSLFDMRETIGRYFSEGSMLIVDEAQHLDQPSAKGGQRHAGFEWLRAMAEETGCKLVLAGDLSLASAVDRIPQLASRMRRPVVIRRPAPGDVAAVAAAAGIADPAAVRILDAVAKRPGALRNVDNVLRIARLFAGAAPVGAAHVGAAVQDLGLAPKGGRG